MNDTIKIDINSTALVLVDLQKGVLGMPGKPYSSDHVLSNAVQLADTFRERGGLVVLIHVGSDSGGKDMLDLLTDASLGGGERPDNWMELAPELGPKPEDVVITKRQWGGFYGTDLDLQLRRRGINTLVMGGIATNFGVESTARDAYERNYAQIFAEDAMTDLDEDAHQFAVDYVFKRMGRVRSTEEVLEGLK